MFSQTDPKSQHARHRPAEDHSLRPSRLRRAALRHSIKVRRSKGLVKRATAPAFSTRARTVSSGKAVMKINGTRYSRASKKACSSTPLMPGIWTSVITHDVFLRSAECKNSSADEKVCPMYPSDVRRFSLAIRTDGSSSMTEITGGIDTLSFFRAE